MHGHVNGRGSRVPRELNRSWSALLVDYCDTLFYKFIAQINRTETTKKNNSETLVKIIINNISNNTLPIIYLTAKHFFPLNENIQKMF